MSTRDLRDRARFFFKNAGYVVGKRMVCAMSLARAERRAEAMGLECRWDYDQEPWECADDGCEPGCQVLSAWIPDPEHPRRALASLGAIHLRPGDRVYPRVVAAELFVEALEALAERTVESLEDRATYAAGGPTP